MWWYFFNSNVGASWKFKCKCCLRNLFIWN